MGYIKEPQGVDFFIKSRELSDKDRAEISEFIRADKERRKQEKKRTISTAKRTPHKHS